MESKIRCDHGRVIPKCNHVQSEPHYVAVSSSEIVTGRIQRRNTIQRRHYPMGCFAHYKSKLSICDCIQLQPTYRCVGCAQLYGFYQNVRECDQIRPSTLFCYLDRENRPTHIRVWCVNSGLCMRGVTAVATTVTAASAAATVAATVTAIVCVHR